MKIASLMVSKATAKGVCDWNRVQISERKDDVSTPRLRLSVKDVMN